MDKKRLQENSVLNLRMGIAFYGMWYIWKLRNEKGHGKNLQVQLNQFRGWAGDIIQLIPILSEEDFLLRGILSALRIPLDFKTIIKGRWCCWKPCKNGNTMDLYISEEMKTGTMLCRGNKGNS